MCPLYNQDIIVVSPHISMAFKYLPYFLEKNAVKLKMSLLIISKTGIKISIKFFDFPVSWKKNGREKRLKFCVNDFKFFRIT